MIHFCLFVHSWFLLLPVHQQSSLVDDSVVCHFLSQLTFGFQTLSSVRKMKIKQKKIIKQDQQIFVFVKFAEFVFD